MNKLLKNLLFIYSDPFCVFKKFSANYIIEKNLDNFIV